MVIVTGVWVVGTGVVRFGFGGCYCGQGVFSMFVVVMVDSRCLSWQLFQGCHGSRLRVVHEVGAIRCLWFCGGHISGFNFNGSGFGFGFRPLVWVVARSELVVAMGCSWCGQKINYLRVVIISHNLNTQFELKL